MRTGYIGLGNIGAPMAERLVEQGGDVTLFDAFSAATAAFASRATIAASPADMGASAELIGICVRDDDDVRAVVDGDDGLLRSMTRGAIAVHSTVRPSTIVYLAARAKAKGVDLIDAAVTGGPEVARRGGLTCMVGGNAAQVDRLRPLLSTYCTDIVHAGDTGAGMALKICNNLVTYIQLVAATESYRLADANGLSHERLTQVMTNNGNLTPAMKGYIAFRQSTAATADGADGFAASQAALIHLAEKDLGLAIEIAGEAGTGVPATDAIRSIFRDIISKV